MMSPGPVPAILIGDGLQSCLVVSGSVLVLARTVGQKCGKARDGMVEYNGMQGGAPPSQVQAVEQLQPH